MPTPTLIPLRRLLPRQTSSASSVYPVKVLPYLQTERGNMIHHCPIPEYAQIKTMPIEGNQLWSRLARFFDEVADQLASDRSPVWGAPSCFCANPLAGGSRPIAPIHTNLMKGILG